LGAQSEDLDREMKEEKKETKLKNELRRNDGRMKLD
jgi:hypothetical protein